MHWWRSHQSFAAWFVSVRPHLFKWNSFDNIRHVNILYPTFSQSYCSECILPQPLQCDRWWSPVFHEGNTWGHPPHSRLWRQWPPALSCSGCCSFSELQDSEWCEERRQNNIIWPKTTIRNPSIQLLEEHKYVEVSWDLHSMYSLVPSNKVAVM